MIREGSAFQLCLKILKFYGIYQINATAASITEGIVKFTFIVLQFLIASLYRLCFVSNFNEFIIAVIYVIFSINLTIKLMSFMRNQDKIIHLIEEIEELDDTVDAYAVKDENNRILKISTLLLLSDLSIGFNLSLSILLLSKEKMFTIPLLYYPDCTEAYYMMFGIHYIQIIGIGSISFGVEMIPIVALMKLKNTIGHICDDLELIKHKNLDNLKRCIVLHCRVESVMSKLEHLFGPSFLIQSSMISIFLCILSFKMVSTSLIYNFHEFLYYFGFFLVMILKVALPCYFGQQVTNESEKIFNKVYDLPWYENNLGFRRHILIMMERCQNEIAFNIEGFYTFDFVHLSEIIHLAYSFYSVLQSLGN